MSILEIVMSSAVIVAIIGWIRGGKENLLNHITRERSTWRKEMKECMEGFSGCSVRELDKWLIKLKVNLNGYGCHNSGEYPEDMYLDVFSDEHIWKLIDALETEHKKPDYSIKRIEELKEKIINLIVILLKFDWERSKREVKTNKLLIAACIIAAGYISLVCYFLYQYQQRNTVSPEKIIDNCVMIVIPLLFFHLITWIPLIIDRMKTIRGKKWYRKVMQPVVIWTIGIIGEVLTWYFLGIVFEKVAVLAWSLFFEISSLFPAYQLGKEHALYTKYEQAVIDLLKCDTISIYETFEGSAATKIPRCLLDKGINYSSERDIGVFLKDENFKDFIKEESPKSILTREGKKEYRKINKSKPSMDIFTFIKNNPSFCKSFICYKKEEGNRYGLVTRKDLEKWNL
nr:hypothetical protein [uncultured Mediterraneibacter sp.]